MQTSKQLDARETLSRLRILRGADFHTLSTDDVESLIAEADRVKYRKPHNANGSHARYFHDMLQRRAKDRAFRGWVHS